MLVPSACARTFKRRKSLGLKQKVVLTSLGFMGTRRIEGPVGQRVEDGMGALVAGRRNNVKLQPVPK